MFHTFPCLCTCFSFCWNTHYSLFKPSRLCSYHIMELEFKLSLYISFLIVSSLKAGPCLSHLNSTEVPSQYFICSKEICNLITEWLIKIHEIEILTLLPWLKICSHILIYSLTEKCRWMFSFLLFSCVRPCARNGRWKSDKVLTIKENIVLAESWHLLSVTLLSKSPQNALRLQMSHWHT